MIYILFEQGKFLKISLFYIMKFFHLFFFKSKRQQLVPFEQQHSDK